MNIYIVTRESGSHRQMHWYIDRGQAEEDLSTSARSGDGYVIRADMTVLTVTGEEWAIKELVERAANPPPPPPPPKPVEFVPQPVQGPPRNYPHTIREPYTTGAPKKEKHAKKPNPAWKSQIEGGLRNLGWNATDARQAVGALVPLVDSGEIEATDVPGLMKRALLSLSHP